METLSQKRKNIIPTKPRVFSLDEVSYHADMSSCWIVIKDKVYDVTNFLDEHPGGSEIMLEHAGTDATTLFQDIGHSAEAEKILSKYYIGKGTKSSYVKQPGSQSQSKEQLLRQL